MFRLGPHNYSKRAMPRIKKTSEPTAPETKKPARRAARPKKEKTELAESTPEVVESAATPTPVVEAPQEPKKRTEKKESAGRRRAPKKSAAGSDSPSTEETSPESLEAPQEVAEIVFSDCGDPEGRLVVCFRPRQERAVRAPQESGRNRRDRGRREKSAPAAAAEAPAPVVAPQELVFPETPYVVAADLADDEIFASTVNDLPVVLFREKGSGPGVVPATDAPRDTRRNRRSRGRDVSAADALVPGATEGAPEQRGGPRGRRRDESVKEKTVEAEPEEVVAPAPEPVKRPAVIIPENAPQVVSSGGRAKLIRNGKMVPPFFFFGASLDSKREDTVFEELSLAAENGVHVSVHYVELEVGTQSARNCAAWASRLLARAKTVDPEALLVFRVVFIAPNGWERNYPKAKYLSHEGTLADPSLSDEEYWGQAASDLREFITQIRTHEHADSILGLHLDQTEWFIPADLGYDTSEAAQEKFREWLRLRYRNDEVALRASWFDGKVTFAQVRIPEYRVGGTEDFVRTGRRERRWVDYHMFLSDSAVDRIGKLAYEVKLTSEGMFLVSVSYGYTFEWGHAGSGHLSLGKLLRTPEVDIIAGPPSYRVREPGGTGAFPGPIDSFALNGKLFVSEEDFKTPIAVGTEQDNYNPVIRTPQALESVQWRGVGAALAHGAGVNWMDLWGNGWLSSPGIWHRSKQVLEALTHSFSVPPTDPDVAVFIDERSLAYLSDPRAFTLLVQNVRESVLRSGLNVGFYLLSDLAHRERLPEFKLHIFLNAWDIRPEVRLAIRQRLQRDGKVLFWLYAAGLFDSGRDSLERVREVTGIALKPQPYASKSGTTLLHRRHALCEALPDAEMGQGSGLEPSYFAIPEDSLVLGEYTQTGLPSYVLKEITSEDGSRQKWTSVFLGEPVVTPQLLRALGEIAGVPAWNYHDDVVHVRPPYLTLHCTSSGQRSITLPNKWAAYSLNTQEWMALDQTHLRFSALDGTTFVFLVGPRSDIQTILSTDTNAILEAPVDREESDNTVDLNAMTFDVPIMQLNEWVEEGWSDEMADDLLLKPSQLDVDLPEELSDLDERVSPGTRRRRRKRRGGKDKETEGEAFGMGMNVVFRKRE